ncbi:MAG TPA: hypothetical protein VN646_16835 [Candidatus Acidoferrum sp.]|nr:hypothetical protein [Candidatus Acidoferrum sp.]
MNKKTTTLLLIAGAAAVVVFLVARKAKAVEDAKIAGAVINATGLGYLPGLGGLNL